MRPATRPARPTREVPAAALALLVVLVVGAFVLAACGSTAPTGALGSPDAGASASAPAGSAPGDSGAAASPSGPGATEDTSEARWPGDVVEAVTNLATADSQIQQAGSDLDTAANNQDLKAMWGAADGLATLLHKLEFEVTRIKDFPVTQPLAAAYSVALPDMIAGSEQLRDSITSGDAAGIEAGSGRLAKGLAEYGQVRDLLGPLSDEALLQKKLLLK